MGDQKPNNLVLITVDCLRADVLSCAGGQAATRQMDHLASQGVRYLNAWAHAHFTRPSFKAIFSGLLPWLHSTGPHLDESSPYLPAILQAHGYHTIGINSNTWLSSYFGYQRGFTLYRDLSMTNPIAHRLPVVVLNNLLGWVGGGLAVPPYPTAESVTHAALEALDQVPEPYFLWVHYMDAHWPYGLDRPRLFAPWDRSNRIYNARLAHKSRSEPRRVLSQERAAFQARYCQAIERIDREIGRLMEVVGVNSVVLLTSDHGEAFGEHGKYFHEPNLYIENTHVPLILSGAGVPGNRVENKVVRHVDIVPTLLELARLPDQEGLSGISLAPAVMGQGGLPDLDAVSYFEQNSAQQRWIAIRNRDWAALAIFPYGSDEPVQVELYDYRRDPGEQEDVADRYPDQLQLLLRRALDTFQLAKSETPTPWLASEAREVVERLKALGYME